MARLYLLESGETLAEITQEQLEFLMAQLEEEHAGDQDYHVNRGTLEMLREEGCDQELLTLLDESLGEQEAIEIAWD